MSAQTWKEVIASCFADGAALANSAVATSLLPASAKATLLPGFFSKLPQRLCIKAGGRISTLNAAPGTFTFDVRFGGTVVWTGGAINLNATAQVNASWELELRLQMRTLGSAANLLGIGSWRSRALIGSAAVAAGGVGVIVLPDTAPAAGNNFDATISELVDLFGTWSVANAANSITLHDYELSSEN